MLELLEGNPCMDASKKERLIDANLESITINDKGSFLALTFKLVFRESKRLKTNFFVLYCASIPKDPETSVKPVIKLKY